MGMRQLRRDSEGVASTIATLFSLLIFLMFFQISVLAPIPARQYDAEWTTSREALSALELTRSVLAGPSEVGTTFSVPIPVGTAAVSPFATESPGLLSFRGSQIGPRISFRYVPDFLRSSIKHLDQDVILAIDSSGSMNANDPDDLRVEGAKEFVDQLRCPDRIAILDFDHDAYFTPTNKYPSRLPHHLSHPDHDCAPSFNEVKVDLDTIDSAGNTNFGGALVVALDEFQSYGDYRHAWTILLLTDGQNNYGWQDTLALDQSIRAAGMGVTVFTIGLGDAVDVPLLTQIAENTGGVYYPAPTAESIRWIYMEIANRYSSTFICSEYATVDASAGSFELTLGSREYPAQTLRFEGGGLSLVQRGGAELREGLPFDYQPLDASSGSVGVTLISFVGKDVATTGTGHEIMRATVVARDLVAQHVEPINLTEEADSTAAIKVHLETWQAQGAATAAAVQAVVNHTTRARDSILDAAVNYSAGDVSGAKSEVERAQIYLADAMEEVDVQVAALEMHGFLGQSTKDDIRVTACRLDQWLNWYEGLTFTIDSPAAAGWARWFQTQLKAAGARVAIGLVGNQATLTLHTINEYVIDHRTVELSFGL